MLICTIYDSTAYTSSPLFCAFDDKHAKRTFVSSLGKDHPCVLYPKDYELRIIGEFDEDSAEVSPLLRFAENGNDWKYMIFPVSDLIPDKYKEYCLDGTFENQK